MFLLTLSKNNKESHPIGFSRVELVVLLLVVFFTALIIKLWLDNYRMKTLDAMRAYNLYIIAQALEYYHGEHGFYPPQLSYQSSFNQIINGRDDILTKELVPRYLEKIDFRLYQPQSFTEKESEKNKTSLILNCPEGPVSQVIATDFSHCGYHLVKCFDGQDHYIIYCLQRLPLGERKSYLIEKHEGDWVIKEKNN